MGVAYCCPHAFSEHMPPSAGIHSHKLQSMGPHLWGHNANERDAKHPMNDQLPVSLEDIQRAATRIAGQVSRTPCIPSHSIEKLHFKLETTQPTGAFKLRGATNHVLSLSDAERARGVTTCSTGNHGRAVAYAARNLGIRAVICMSSLVPQNKVDAVKALDAEVRIIGKSQDDAQIEVNRLVEEEGMMAIPPFDGQEVVAGQGTIGLELLEDLPELDAVLVPLSGGGLMAGIATALKLQRPTIRVIGISMERGAAMDASLKAGKPVSVTEEETLADSLGGGIGLDNSVTFPICKELVDEVVLLTEDEILAGMRHLFYHEKIVTEGGAAVGVGAVLCGKVKLDDFACAATIISGNNVDMQRFYRLMKDAT